MSNVDEVEQQEKAMQHAAIHFSVKTGQGAQVS